MMENLIRQPFLHFLLLGLGMFILFDLVSDDEADKDMIVVDRDALLNFVQFRTRAFEPGVAAERLDAMSKAEVAQLVDEYVREEALYREALALGLDANDYVIKRRLIQKVEFITDSFVDEAVELSDADVEARFTANVDDYYVEPFVTFTHVFFDDSHQDSEEIARLATEKLAELNRRNLPFSESGREGDRFLYHRNYVERTRDFVSDHFGPKMAAQIFKLEVDNRRWQGPFRSPFGLHLVMVAKRAEGRVPELDEIRARVRDDARRDKVRQRTQEAIQRVVDRYQVSLRYQRSGAGSGFAGSEKVGL